MLHTRHTPHGWALITATGRVLGYWTSQMEAQEAAAWVAGAEPPRPSA